MALIKVEMSMPPVDGMDIKFKAPCDCTQVTGLLVEYPEGSKEFTFRDCHGNNLAGIGNLFGAGAYIKVIVDVGKGYAYLQNADNNGFLNSAVLGTYTHDGGNLTGHGENGKFKATTSGTISTINVNGVACSVKCGEESSIDLIAGNWYTFILDGDTVNFNSGGAGGGGLNFQVYGSLQPPVSPKENTIWIETDTPITGYEFAAAEPANMTEGMVWISTGTSSSVSFNALKKNGIEVYPLSAQQYVDGKLNALDAYSYVDNAWIQFSYKRFYLYNTGDECTDVTGGWVGVSAGTSDKRYVPEINKYETTMRTRLNQNQSDRLGNNATGSCKPANTIDLTNFSTITFVVTQSKNPMANNRVGVTTDLTSSKFTFTASANADVGTHTIDISNISGKCRVMIMPWANDPEYVNLVDAYITVSQVYME